VRCAKNLGVVPAELNLRSDALVIVFRRCDSGRNLGQRLCNKLLKIRYGEGPTRIRLYSASLPPYKNRAPRMMKSVAAEVLDRWPHVCASVVVVIPQEIAGHTHFLRLVPCRLVARILKP
jgi:hypothetical protein